VDRETMVTLHDKKSISVPHIVISRPSDLPVELGLVIYKWLRFFDMSDDVKRGEWFTKHSALSFVYEDEHYVLYPESVGVTGHTFGFAYQSVYDVYEGDITNDLRDIGATEFHSHGMLD
jgi:hypothetical protein